MASLLGMGRKTATEALNTIIAKPDWQKKLNNPDIVEKWSKELLEQDSQLPVDMLFSVLRNAKVAYDNKSINALFSSTELYGSQVCNCCCPVCVNPEGSSYGGGYSTNRIETCICDLRIQCRKKYLLDRFTSTVPNLVSLELRQDLLSLFSGACLPHPGTNGRSLDYRHPSFLSFISGLSIVHKPVKLDPHMLFCWLATNALVLPSIDSTSAATSSRSVRMQNEPACIEKLCTLFLTQFERVLDTLYKTKHIKGKRTLDKFQVIIKVQEMVLTPEQPVFPEGSWHLEGTRFEHILATGIHYLEMKNLKPHALSFRIELKDGEDLGYDSAHSFFFTHYGLEQKDEDNGEAELLPLFPLGDLPLAEGDSLVFPNCLHHRVPAVELEDPSQNGSRKIVVFFLVDPAHRILALEDVTNPELSDHQKLSYCELLMFQRQKEIGKWSEAINGRSWSLCEH
ncbi:unnamed protein product [Sphagnum jensenii]|uniref:DUF4246 domain-containing protein n=1 Tax=Sphagnum jensenii TaxID=128206 RepID=A0ABP0VFF9_9BRYO